MADDFEIEGINLDELDEKGKELYSKLEKQFKGAYTKKTQALASERSQWEQEKATLNQDLITVKGEVDRFNQWWAGLTPEQQTYYNRLTPGQQQQVTDDMGLVHPAESAQEFKAIQKEVGELRNWGNKIYQGFQNMENKMGSFEKSLRLTMDWVDFRLKHPDADRKRMFDRMGNEGITNFDLAYDMEYGKENQEKEWKEREEKIRTEEREKLQSESKIPEFSQGNPFAPKPVTMEGEASKSYGEASGKFKEGLISAFRSKAS